MSNYYQDVYLKRLNRYGNDYQSRIQAQREREFEGKLLKSLYRVDFEYNGEVHPGTLETNKQDQTQLTQYLLTRVSLDLPNGTLLMIPDKNSESQPWLVYWMETIQASGYNKYIMLKMTHCIEWDVDGAKRKTWCYLHGAGDSALKETLKGSGALYAENDNSIFVIMPLDETLCEDTYLEIGENALRQGYRVTGRDVHSTPGVEYVTLNPMYLKDQTPVEKNPEDDSDNYFWLNGGEA